MIQNCIEQVLDDVVRVDLVLASECKLDIPFQVALTEMAGTYTESGVTKDRIGTAGLSLAYNVQDSDDGEIDSAPTLKQAEKQQAAGIVVTHTLNVPLAAGFKETRVAVKGLQTRYFHVVLTTEAGTRYLLYSLPNTSLLLLEEDDINHQSTVRITLRSMSHAIRLT